MYIYVWIFVYVYTCIYIHILQSSPNFSKKQIKSVESPSPMVGSPIEINEQGKSCPQGKVPIQRSKSNHQFGHQFSHDFPGEHVSKLHFQLSLWFFIFIDIYIYTCVCVEP